MSTGIIPNQITYQSLVAQRKICGRCLPFTNPKTNEVTRLVNPAKVSGGKYDSDEIGPWTLWQGSLTAQIMVIGKDFGPVWYFDQNKGKDNPNNPTNRTVIHDIRSLGISIEHPDKKIQNDLLFFTNSVLCLPEKIVRGQTNQQNQSGMSYIVCDHWVKTCSEEFLRHLIGLVRPKAIITLGKEAFKAVAYAYKCHRSWGIEPGKDFVLAGVVDAMPYQAPDGTLVLPAFHPSNRGRNRTPAKNTKDWRTIKQSLDGILN